VHFTLRDPSSNIDDRAYFGAFVNFTGEVHASRVPTPSSPQFPSDPRRIGGYDANQMSAPGTPIT